MLPEHNAHEGWGRVSKQCTGGVQTTLLEHNVQEKYDGVARAQCAGGGLNGVTRAPWAGGCGDGVARAQFTEGMGTVFLEHNL